MDDDDDDGEAVDGECIGSDSNDDNHNATHLISLVARVDSDLLQSNVGLVETICRKR